MPRGWWRCRRAWAARCPAPFSAAGRESRSTVAREYDDIMGRGNYFLEVQANGLPEQETVNAGILEIAKQTGIPIVATNDCHYLERKDARAHEILMCVGQKTTVADSKRLQHPTDAYYLRSPEEMNALFAHLPEALENAERIGELCNVELELGKTLPAAFPGARRLRRRLLPARSWRTRGSRSGWPRRPAWARSSTPTRTASASSSSWASSGR